MKNWKLILTVVSAILFAGVVSGYSQDTTSMSTRDSLDVQIDSAEQEIAEMAKKLEVLLAKLGEKTSEQIQKEVAREIAEAMKELEEELKDLNKELEEESRELERELEEEAKELERELEEEAEERERDGDERKDRKGESEDIFGEVLDGLDIKFNKKKDKLANVKTRWFLVDLGFASYIAPQTLPEINGINPMEPDIINSVSWRLHLVNQRINLINHRVNLMYGAGFSFNFYGFSNPVTLVPSSPSVNFTIPDGNEVSYKKNHLRASYLHLPVMLNLETNPYQKSKSFHLNAGVYGNVLMGGKTSQKTDNRKSKIKNKYNLENFQYGLIGQIGYGPVTFYGTYGLNELFKAEKDNGYTVNPITFG